MIKRVEPLTKRHQKKNPSHSASWAFVVGYPVAFAGVAPAAAFFPVVGRQRCYL